MESSKRKSVLHLMSSRAAYNELWSLCESVCSVCSLFYDSLKISNEHIVAAELSLKEGLVQKKSILFFYRSQSTHRNMYIQQNIMFLKFPSFSHHGTREFVVISWTESIRCVDHIRFGMNVTYYCLGYVRTTLC